jgi:hypothetical protein
MIFNVKVTKPKNILITSNYLSVMTTANKTLKNNKINNQDEAMKLLKEVNQKLDYIVKLLREEEYKYPFHNNYINDFEKNEPKNL